MTDLANFTGLVPRDHGLAVVSTLRPDGTIGSSVVNAAAHCHPARSTTVTRGVARR